MTKTVKFKYDVGDEVYIQRGGEIIKAQVCRLCLHDHWIEYRLEFKGFEEWFLEGGIVTTPSEFLEDLQLTLNSYEERQKRLKDEIKKIQENFNV